MPILKKSASKKKKRARVKEEMHKFEEKKLHSGSKKGPIVTNPKQAIAISLHEAGEGLSKKKSKKKDMKKAPKKKK